MVDNTIITEEITLVDLEVTETELDVDGVIYIEKSKFVTKSAANPLNVVLPLNTALPLNIASTVKLSK